MKESLDRKFDAKSEFAFRLRTDAGPQNVVVRFPADAEAIEYSRRVKRIQNSLGRGGSSFDIDTKDAAMWLYGAIRVSGESPDLNEFEAAKVATLVIDTTVRGVTLTDPHASVELEACGIGVSHLMRIPSERQVYEWRAAALRVISKPYGRQEMRVLLEPSGHLYDELRVEVTGYENDIVPINHKDDVIRALVTYIEEEAGAPN